MPDITLCSNGATCPNREICARYAKDIDREGSYQNFFDGNYCDFFLANTEFLA